MFGIVGTIPEKDFPLTCGVVSLEKKEILVDGNRIPINRGTPAMIAAALETLNYLGKPAPFCYLVGDIGSGDGCRHLYKYLIEHITGFLFHTLALHYFQPEVNLFKQLLSSIDTFPVRPILIADAGFMYVAKMGGDAASFDLFTPDAGELAYLADEKAPHPFYTRGFILHEDNQVPDLIKRAYLYKNASNYLLVKGATDYIADKNGVIAKINSPNIESLEAIGGTGDTLTGIVSALIASGMDIKESMINASKINRQAGYYAQPTPATQIYDITKHISRALDKVLRD